MLIELIQPHTGGRIVLNDVGELMPLTELVYLCTWAKLGLYMEFMRTVMTRYGDNFVIMVDKYELPGGLKNASDFQYWCEVGRYEGNN